MADLSVSFVLHDFAISSMSLALRLTISLDAFRDFVQRLAHMSTATISHFCALGSGTLRNVQCVGSFFMLCECV